MFPDRFVSGCLVLSVIWVWLRCQILELEEPIAKLKVVHVAGTKGKVSAPCCMWCHCHSLVLALFVLKFSTALDGFRCGVPVLVTGDRAHQ